MNGPAVLYDAAVEGNPWLSIGMAIFFLIAALVSYALMRRSKFGRANPRNAMFIGCVWLLAPIAPMVEVPHEFSVMSAVREGRAQVVEGEVEDIRDFRQHRGPNTMCFRVGDVHLEIVPYRLHDMLHGGEHVRIHYVGDTENAEVVRVELWPYKQL